MDIAGISCNGCDVATVGRQEQSDKTAILIRSINAPAIATGVQDVAHDPGQLHSGIRKAF
jgi:hypothetical protein